MSAADSLNDLITLQAHLEPLEAQILRARLQADGIPAYLLGDQHVQANWLHAIALGGVRLQVRARDEVQAVRILEALQRGDYELSEQEIERL